MVRFADIERRMAENQREHKKQIETNLDEIKSQMHSIKIEWERLAKRSVSQSDILPDQEEIVSLLHKMETQISELSGKLYKVDTRMGNIEGIYYAINNKLDKTKE
jgi:hypothetical protein